MSAINAAIVQAYYPMIMPWSLEPDTILIIRMRRLIIANSMHHRTGYSVFASPDC